MAQHWILVTDDYLPMKGGVARYLGDLVHASNAEMRVIVPTDHPVTTETVERRRFFASGGPFRWWPLIGLMRCLGRRPDTSVFISHVLPIGTAAWLASFVSSISYTILFHGLDLQLAKRSVWKWWLTKQIVKRAKRIYVNSKFVADECRSAFPEKIPVLLTPGYEPRTLPSREQARKRLSLQTDEIILLTVARLIPRKGIDRILEVLPELPEQVRFVAIGDGRDRARLEGLAKPFGERVKLLGAVDDATRDDWYAAADVFVFPVRKDGDDLEGYGIVCVEAAAAGLPVVVGKNGGAPETVIPEETGLVVDADQRSELTAALRRLIQDEELRKRFGAAGRARVIREGKWEDRWNILANF